MVGLQNTIGEEPLRHYINNIQKLNNLKDFYNSIAVMYNQVGKVFQGHQDKFDPIFYCNNSIESDIGKYDPVKALAYGGQTDMILVSNLTLFEKDESGNQ